MFDKFPSAEEFAGKTIITPDQANVVLTWIAEHCGTEYSVSKNACEMAAHAINAGMDWRKVAVLFATNYRNYYNDAKSQGIDVSSWHKPFNVDEDESVNDGNTTG